MTDTFAGITLTDLHFTPTESDTETGSYTTTLSANFGVTTSGGTYADCGVAFIGPATGRVFIWWVAQLDNGTAASKTIICPHVRNGSTVGSGTDVLAAADANSLFNQGTDERRSGAPLLVTGLTPGAAYNVRLEHKVTAATTGTIVNRHIAIGIAA